MKLFGVQTSKKEKKADTSVREFKSFSFELESADESTGEFSGYAAVFGNVDSGNDVIEKGAFVKTITEDFDRIKILSQHNEYELPIGRPIELREDEKGLYIRGRISDTQKGRDIRTLLKDGVLTELSIGYDTIVFDYDSTTNLRHLKEIRLWEVSIVTWAMNERARIEDVKSLADELRAEVKSGKLTRARLEALKPFIAVVRELADILSPFLDFPKPDAAPKLEPPTDEEDGSKQSSTKNKQTKKSGIIFEIVPLKTGGNEK